MNQGPRPVSYTHLFVGDLAQLPLREHSIDVILDIFSPANYQEFGRLLSCLLYTSLARKK